MYAVSCRLRLTALPSTASALRPPATPKIEHAGDAVCPDDHDLRRRIAVDDTEEAGNSLFASCATWKAMQDPADPGGGDPRAHERAPLRQRPEQPSEATRRGRTP